MQLYQITHHIVDVARNQIIRDQGSVDEVIQTLPPKTIQVLTEFAKSQGQVVSHDQLMNVVWQNTVVSPNSIQRCITQLRKALADDSKQQRIIKTHAKQGYSLEVPVKIIQNSTQTSDQLPTEHLGSVKQNISPSNKTIIEEEHEPVHIPNVTLKNQKTNATTRIMSLVSLLILVIVTYSYFSPTPRDFNFNTLTPITSSDNLERNASFSPDGKFVLFHRYDGLCDNNIWTKELATGREYKLTKTYGFYSDHSFTQNGDKLAFMAKVSCGQKKEQKKKNACWNLMTLDFAKALKEPQKPELIVSCDQGALSRPIWLNNGNIVALNKQDSRWQLVKFMPGAPSYVPLYTSSDKNYYHLMYLNKREKLVALAVNSLNEHVIDLISPKGQLLSSHVIERPNVISPYLFLDPVIDPQQEQLLFSTGKRLFSLSIEGKIAQVSTLSHNYLANIKMNETGSEIVTVQGFIDTDIAKVNLEIFDPNQKPHPIQNQNIKFNQVRQPYPSFARSIAEDYDAKFQPKGTLIAFISTRSGTSQIWIKNNNKLTQLTNFPIDTIISSFSWAPSGASIMLTANSELFNVLLDKSISKIAMKFAVLNLFQWQEDNTLLISVRQASLPQLITYNLTSHESTILIDDETHGAAQFGLDQLLYIDKNYKLWITTENKTQQIEKLKIQLGSKRFIFENGNVFGINKHKQLWSYTPKTDVFQILGTMDNYTSFISDIRGSELLLTQVIMAKKEVVVLSNKGN